MEAGITFSLFIAAVFVWILGILLIRKYMPLPMAVFVSSLKAAVPFIYFAWFYDGTWTFLDDMSYLSQGSEMLQLGYIPITALINSDAVNHLMELSGGHHILYGWWNMLGQYLLGEHYYASVFLNVILTFISGFCFVQILSRLGFNQKYRIGFLIFFLLQWDVLVWSSFINLKDTMIMTLTVISIRLIMSLIRDFRISTLAILGLIFFIFYWIRFYVPILILTATGIWMFFNWHNRKKYIFLLAMIGGFYLFVPFGPDELKYFRPLGVIYGAIRFLLTPQPWSLEKSYSFLLFPSILHWLFFLPALTSVWLLWRSEARLLRFILIYFMVVVVFYAMVPELQGPRHRLQISFILSWLQFHFLWTVVHAAVSRKVTLVFNNSVDARGESL